MLSSTLSAVRVRSPRSRRLRGFTLIEVLVVVAIIALLIAILLPSLAEARRQSRIVVCATNLRTIAQSTIYYAEAHKDLLPESGATFEAVHLYVKKPSGKSSDGVGHSTVMNVNIPWYYCPDDIKPHTTGERRVQLPNGTTQIYFYETGYAVNNNVSWAVRPVGSKPGVARKMASIKNPTSVVWYCDSGDDDINGAGPWYLTECNHVTNQVQHELHHKVGNNFVYMDNHIGFKTLNWNPPQYGLPTFPNAWMPNGEGYEQYKDFVRPAPEKSPPQL